MPQENDRKLQFANLILLSKLVSFNLTWKIFDTKSKWHLVGEGQPTKYIAC